MSFVERSVQVRVPATSANLGPGFDALGLALGLHDELTARVTADGLRIEVEGAGSADVARDESHLVVRAMRRCFAELGVEPAGLSVTCTNRIPHARGLGSSSAAIVAGLLLARGLVMDGANRLSTGDVLVLAAELEGHPDNVAPCLLGGLTVAWTQGGAARAIRRDVDPSIVPVVLVPSSTSSTAQARGLLPADVPHRDAAFAAGRAALLVAALTGTPQALLDATEDTLHQSYRAAAMPQSFAMMSGLRAAGHPAVISGAGPTVLVLARGDVEAEAVEAVAPTSGLMEGLTGSAPSWQVRRLPVDGGGAQVRVGR